MTDSSVPVWAFMALISLLQAVVLFIMTKLWASVDRNTEATTSLRVDLPTLYATRADVERHHAEDQDGFDGVRKHMSELRDRVWNLDNRVTAIDGNVKEARAGLRD